MQTAVGTDSGTTSRTPTISKNGLPPQAQPHTLPLPSTSDATTVATAPPETLTIRVENQGGDQTFFKLKRHTKMDRVFVAYCGRKEIEKKRCVFMEEWGEKILGEATPDSLGLLDGDRIFVCKYGGRWVPSKPKKRR
jgi:small ubiquitin-related modifier